MSPHRTSYESEPHSRVICSPVTETVATEPTTAVDVAIVFLTALLLVAGPTVAEWLLLYSARGGAAW